MPRGWGPRWPDPEQTSPVNRRVGGRYVRAGSAGRAADLGKTWFRSRTERNYARWLTYQGTPWQYEPITFVFERIRSGVRTYRPDFFLPEANEYHEVKGYFTPKDHTKFKRMQKYFPEVKIIVIHQDFFRDICRQRVCQLIPGWECTHTRRGV